MSPETVTFCLFGAGKSNLNIWCNPLQSFQLLTMIHKSRKIFLIFSTSSMLGSIPEQFYPYVYSFGGLVIGLVTILIYWKRPDFRRLMILLSLILLPCSPLAEFLFFQDYWYPPDVISFYLGELRFISGDLILTLVAPPLFVTFVPFILNLKIENLESISLRGLAIKILLSQVLVGSVFALLFYLTDLNSIFCSVIATVVVVIPALFIRRDLIKYYLLAFLVFGIGTFVFYFLYQVFIGDDYLQAVWLLDHSAYSVNFFGILVPFTEVMFGAFAGPFYLLLLFFLEPKLRLTKI